MPETVPATPDALFARLGALAIPFVNHTHAPVMTVAESQALRGTINGLHSKNLFLKDKKGGLWLVVAWEDQSIDLKTLRKRLGAANLSFANADLMAEVLGVTPGSVTPFAVINDRGRAVRVVLDQTLAQGEVVNFHPLDNAQTTSLSGQHLLTFLRAEHHDPMVLDFNAP